MSTASGAAQGGSVVQRDRLVIAASSVGTVFEWYDFFLYGALATIISKQFFSGVNETTGYIFALLAFASGFVVRPFGALVFGRLGDMWGRKNTFLITMLLMGLSTFVVGLVPGYATIGVAAPAVLVIMRLVQGLALGGEYGGAATYVAEHAPPGRRGFYTSWIQATATIGLFVALGVILVTRGLTGEDAFAAWGWRVPFLVSAVLLGASLWIRLKLHESPSFQKMVSEGKTSKAPLTESFARWGNLRIVLIALFGLTAGQAVIWYTGQFYALFFLEKTLKLDGSLANLLLAIALALGAPGFIFFGWLSDKIGRKPIILTGCALAALTYFPLFHMIAKAGNPELVAASTSSPVTVVADPKDCAFQFDPVGKKAFVSSCDLAKSWLAKAGIGYANEAAAPGSVAVVRIGTVAYPSFAGDKLPKAELADRKTAWEAGLGDAVKAAGYPAKADSAKVDKVMLVALLTVLILYATMVYGPIAAMLVELFPTSIRYTSMSLPYHIGNGWFGGFLPTTAFALVAATGDSYYGLWYPIVIAGATVVIGVLLVPETKDVDIDR
ncbi:MAG: transporter [Rhizorhabdus sp.]|nr:transporter [Rhizorhabdus sp.]